MQQAEVYPVRFEVARPEKQSRLLGLPLLIGTAIRLILLIPSLLVLYYLEGAALIAGFVSFWGILFTGRYPRGLFKLEAGVMRWYFATYAYMANLFDEYPPMDLEQRVDRTPLLEVDYPEHPSRWLNLPFFPVKFILAIPHFIVLYVLYVLGLVVIFIAQFAILFSGSFPAGLHRFLAGTYRWNARVVGYVAGFTDRYPPFSLS